MRWILVVLGALSLLGCERALPAPLKVGGDATPRRGGTVNIATSGDIRSLDPATITDGLAPQIVAHLFASLVEYDDAGKPRPELAESFSVEDEGKTYRFVLRQGVRFHDGDELTADDVKRSAERALHPDTPNPYASYYASLDGYAAFSTRKSADIRGISVDGRYVVSFHLTDRDATFLYVLAMLPLRPTCKSAGHRYSDGWHPCGAGPFKLEPNGWEHARSVTLVRHPGYYQPDLPRLDAVRWTFRENQTTQTFKFLRGDLDVIRELLGPDLLRLQADPRWTPFADYEAEKQILGEAMNVEIPPFDNVEIRRAVACAIDREAMRKVRAASFRVANQAVPADVFGHDPALEGQRYDYPAALEHMRRAGYPYDPATKTGGWPHAIPYVVYKQSLQELTSQVVAEQLAKIGIRIEIRIVNYATMLALRGRRGATAIGPGMWTEDFPDALSFLEPLFHSRSIADEDSNNWSFYTNPRVDDLVDRAKRELDDERRKVLYTDAQRIIVDDAPWAFTETFRFYTQRQAYVREHRAHPMWMHDLTRTWLDRAAGSVGARAVLSSDRFAAALGGGWR